MRNKIQNSFNELPATSHDSLRDSLITHVGQITSETDPIIVKQLSLAVADLALLMASWKDPIGDLLKMMSHQPTAVWPLLEILTLIPEEIDSRYLRLGANRREEIHKQMDAAAAKVLEFLCVCLAHSEGAPERIINSTLQCFCAWVSIQAIPIELAAESAIAEQVFRLLTQADTSRKLHDTSTECLCAILSCIEANSSRYNMNVLLGQQVFNGVCALEPAYHTSVALEDIDKTMNYCRIFTVLCEAFFYDMLSNENTPHYSIKGLDLVLMCVGHFDYEVAEITFNLWYRLSEDLFQRNNDHLTAHFKPHIERLLGALYRHAQIDADHDGLIEENDSFNVSI